MSIHYNILEKRTAMANVDDQHIKKMRLTNVYKLLQKCAAVTCVYL